MIQVICDVCGKQLQNKFVDCVNIDFNSYAIEDEQRFTYGREFNLCVPCAHRVYDAIKEIIEEPREEPK